MALTVLGRVTSINVRKVLWAADEMGLSYEREDWGLPLRDPNEPQFLALNPNALVPVIIEDDFVLWESHAIIRYLSATNGDALLPRQPRERAIVDQWLGWQASDLNVTWGYAFMALARRAPAFMVPDRIADSIQRWSAKMAVLEQRLAETNGFVAGAAFTLADIPIGLSVHRWLGTPMERPEMPATAAYYDRLQSRPAGARWMSPEVP